MDQLDLDLCPIEALLEHGRKTEPDLSVDQVSYGLYSYGPIKLCQ